MNLRGRKGITLISLIITIIILIILACVIINLSVGENGLLKKTKSAKQQYEIAEAKEYIEMKIDECTINKEGNASLQDIVDYLAEDSNVTYYVALQEIALVAGEVNVGTTKEIYVVYNRYQFNINENKRVSFISIVDVELEGKMTIDTEVKKHLGKNEEGNYTASILLKAKGESEIKKLEIQNPDGTIVTLEPEGLATVGKDITIEFDKEYKVILTTENGNQYTKKIIEKSEEMIMTAEELANFRDKVNSGLTYEGKTINLGADIDLSTVCGENINGEEISWEPIGYYIDTENYLYFKGTFDGNYHKISNLYYNNSPHSVVDNYIGLFAGNEGNIKNIYLVDANIIVKGYSEESSVWRGYVGGITGINRGIIDNIGIERGNIKLYEKSGRTALGGIVGLANSNSIIRNSYNKANVSGMASNSNIVRIGGIAGVVIKANGLNPIVKNCYNIGTLSNVNGTKKYIGGIVGTNGVSNNYPGGEISNSYVQTTLTAYSSYYWNGTKITTSKEGMVSDDILKSSASTLGDAFTDDIQNEDGTWKYNDGYPILKWQLEVN